MTALKKHYQTIFFAIALTLVVGLTCRHVYQAFQFHAEGVVEYFGGK